MKSARFYILYTMHIGRHTQLHKSDIQEIIFFEASVELNDNEILSTCFYVYAKLLLYLKHLSAPPSPFLIYQFQFLSVCHSSREAEDILKNSGRCHSSRPRPSSFIPSSSQPPLVNRCNHTRCKWHYYSVLFKTLPFDPVILPYHGKKLFLFLKHQSSLNKRTVLSQESNNNFLYIWQTGFCIFSLILFYDPKSTLFPRT